MPVGEYFNFMCSNQHVSGAPYKLTKCPNCINGKPCSGALTEVHLWRGEWKPVKPKTVAS